MSKSMFVDGRYCRSMSQAAIRIGCSKSTVTRLSRRGIYRYNGHTFGFVNDYDIPKVNMCPHCGMPIVARFEVA